MKLKQSPDDFRVEELTTITASEGPFAFYRLEKSGWTTPDAMQAIRRQWKIDLRRLSFGGLKDRHAHTFQYFTIFHGPKRQLQQRDFTVSYLGQIPQAYISEDIRANLFTITLRDLADAEVRSAEAALLEIGTLGVPNYFDDQRFGSVGVEEAFIAKEMVLGNFEEALRLAVATPSEHDRAEAKREKAILREHWGLWSVCKAKLTRHPRTWLYHLLQDPSDFRGAVARLHPELQGLYLAAWQSHLWNRMLAEWLRQRLPENQQIMIRLRMGDFPAARSLSAEHLREWDRLELPLPSARLRWDPDADWAAVLQKVLAEEGIALEQMKIPGMRKPFFSKGVRPAVIRPHQLESTVADDEKHPGHRKIILRFSLPRGAYATMIVKRLTCWE